MSNYSDSLNSIGLLRNIDLESKDSYYEVFQLIANMYIPIDLTKQIKGSFLHRARRNTKSDKYYFKEQISYNYDYRKITEFGRANEINQSIFYASIDPQTALFETSNLLREKNIHEKIERFTVGRWRVMEDISLVAMVSNEEARRNEIIKRLYEISLTKSLANDETNQIRKYFSDEFAKRSNNNSNLYKISCAFFNYILSRPENKEFGILYPSVGYEFQDINVALLPIAVDSFLALDGVSEYEIDMKCNNITQVEIIDIKAWTTKSTNI